MHSTDFSLVSENIQNHNLQEIFELDHEVEVSHFLHTDKRGCRYLSQRGLNWQVSIRFRDLINTSPSKLNIIDKSLNILE